MKKTNKSNKAIKYRIYPNDNQRVMFAKTFGCCRFVYNQILAIQKERYANGEKNLSKFKTNEYTIHTLKEEYIFIKEVDKFAITNAVFNLADAYNRFFKKQNHLPKFKSKRKSKKSYTTNFTNNNIVIGEKEIKLPKLGYVKAVIHRLPKDDWKIKSVTVSQDSVGNYFASVLFEYEQKEVSTVSKSSTNAIGLDYKSDGLYMDNKGNKAGTHKYYKESQKKLAKEQRNLSRKIGSKKGETKSNNYLKQQKKVNKIHRKIANQRKDSLHKKSTEIANQYDIVCVEDLDMKAIGNKDFGNGKATFDNGYGMFLNMLDYKFKERGKYFVKVDKWYPSSQICHCCGRKKKMDLNERVYKCECGYTGDRDQNAAINILKEGLRILKMSIQTVKAVKI